MGKMPKKTFASSIPCTVSELNCVQVEQTLRTIISFTSRSKVKGQGQMSPKFNWRIHHNRYLYQITSITDREFSRFFVRTDTHTNATKEKHLHRTAQYIEYFLQEIAALCFFAKNSLSHITKVPGYI